MQIYLLIQPSYAYGTIVPYAYDGLGVENGRGVLDREISAVRLLSDEWRQ